MKIKLDQLRSIVRDAMNDEKLTEGLRVETKNALGPIMDTNVGLVELAESINLRLKVLELTGRSCSGFKTATLVKLSKNSRPEVRAVAATLLPESFLSRFVTDASSKVRLIAARRLPEKVVKEMLRKFPSDDELRLIYSKKRVDTKKATLAEVTQVGDDLLHIHDDEALGDLGKEYAVELSDEWYETKARSILDDYSKHRMIDYNWEERAVNAFCDASRTTAGVDIDRKKLFKAVQDRIKEREDVTLSRETIFDIRTDESRSFDKRFDFSVLNEHSEMPVFPVIEETVDQVKNLLAESMEFNEKFAILFSLKETTIPANVKRLVEGEGFKTNKVPASAIVPHSNGIRSIDEHVLDRFVETWNRQQVAKHEPFHITWNQNVHDCQNIEFTVGLR